MWPNTVSDWVAFILALGALVSMPFTFHTAIMKPFRRMVADSEARVMEKVKEEKENRETADSARDEEQRRTINLVNGAIGRVEILERMVSDKLEVMQRDLAYIKGGLDATGVLKPPQER